jgi:hypothetical protein
LGAALIVGHGIKTPTLIIRQNKYIGKLMFRKTFVDLVGLVVYKLSAFAVAFSPPNPF